MHQVIGWIVLFGLAVVVCWALIAGSPRKSEGKFGYDGLPADSQSDNEDEDDGFSS